MPAKQLPIDDHKKQAFLEWLVTPPKERNPGSMEELAPLLGVHPRTLSNWKKDKEFRQAWQDRSTELVGDPDRAKEVLDALFYTARDTQNRNHVSAARLYLEAIDAISPKKVDVTVQSKEAAKLTDAELTALIAQGAAELQAERNRG